MMDEINISTISANNTVNTVSNSIDFEIVNDELVRYIPTPQYGNGMAQREVIITKEAFIKCYNEWIKDNSNPYTYFAK